ncbi:hypothetical protein P175DRAFT_0277227 [Aspergillus ochraceoroseus IBT 24754]|uniref:Uncharacterized protein n=1 Tax=Aspergillus ochraceoroseus IBT 24754 TaxID=1392256 RepID=A0A2T5LVG4_9EURO|nr:uncharacterized protein P175DRAFT_0277227 [Aspergillus ochraceoroseus IBT 24754]PTU20270.1 hypothetical protein P175DRAFT_0277227 [Aspergillus ochraceoroseus IBT 24754]
MRTAPALASGRASRERGEMALGCSSVLNPNQYVRERRQLEGLVCGPVQSSPVQTLALYPPGGGGPGSFTRVDLHRYDETWENTPPPPPPPKKVLLTQFYQPPCVLEAQCRELEMTLFTHEGGGASLAALRGAGMSWSFAITGTRPRVGSSFLRGQGGVIGRSGIMGYGGLFCLLVDGWFIADGEGRRKALLFSDIQ